MQTTSTHIFLCKEKKERQGGEKRKKIWENRTRKRCVETEKHQPSEITNLSRSSPPGETTKAAGILYLPQTALCLCPCLSTSLWGSLLSLYCAGRDRSKWSLNPTWFANFGDLEIYLCYNWWFLLLAAAAAAETGLECWYSLRIFWLILGRFFRNSFLPLALFVATSTKKVEIQPYLNAVDSFFSNFYFYMSAGGSAVLQGDHRRQLSQLRRLAKIRQLFRNWETGPKFWAGQQKKQKTQKKN